MDYKHYLMRPAKAIRFGSREASGNRKKLNWIEVAAKFFTGAVVGILGLVVTLLHNGRQNELRRLELLVKIEPLINSGVTEKIRYGYALLVEADSDETIATLLRTDGSKEAAQAATDIVDSGAVSGSASEEIESAIRQFSPVALSDIETYVANLEIQRGIQGLLIGHTLRPQASEMPPDQELNVMKRMSHVAVSSGWNGLSGHFYIAPSGRIWPGRPIDSRPAMARNNNSGKIGVYLVIDGDEEKPTANQKAAFAKLLSALERRFPAANLREKVRSEEAFQRSYSRKSSPGTYIVGAEMAEWADR